MLKFLKTNKMIEGNIAHEWYEFWDEPTLCAKAEIIYDIANLSAKLIVTQPLEGQENIEFFRRSLVRAALIKGIKEIWVDDSGFEVYGFKPSGNQFVAKAQDVVFESLCGGH